MADREKSVMIDGQVYLHIPISPKLARILEQDLSRALSAPPVHAAPDPAHPTGPPAPASPPASRDAEWPIATPVIGDYCHCRSHNHAPAPCCPIHSVGTKEVALFIRISYDDLLFEKDEVLSRRIMAVARSMMQEKRRRKDG